MTTYAELMSQAQELMRRAEEARKAEVSTAISEIRSQMSLYGITLADLETSPAKRGAKGVKNRQAPKFRGPNGELWAGGPGRKPQWVLDAIAAGKNMGSFRI